MYFLDFQVACYSKQPRLHDEKLHTQVREKDMVAIKVRLHWSCFKDYTKVSRITPRLHHEAEVSQMKEQMSVWGSVRQFLSDSHHSLQITHSQCTPRRNFIVVILNFSSSGPPAEICARLCTHVVKRVWSSTTGESSETSGIEGF